MEPNKTDKRPQIALTIKVLFLVFALIVAYLFALNGRYIYMDNEYFFDKWTKTIIEIDKLEIIK